MIIKLTWYSGSDAVYIELSDKPFAYGKELDDKRHIDFAADHTPIGVELMNISSGVETTNLPEQKAIEDALDSRNIKVFVQKVLRTVPNPH